MTAPQPPAWHADPTNPTLERWWDGQQWTSATRPRTTATAPPVPAPNRPKWTWKKRATVAVAGIAGLYVIGLALNAVIASGDDSPADTAAQASTSQARAVEATNDWAEYGAKLELTTAELACEEAVEAKLKSPSTAEFEDVTTKKRNDGKVVTTGSVDSQNALGATVRTSFTCTTIGGKTTVDYIE